MDVRLLDGDAKRIAENMVQVRWPGGDRVGMTASGVA